MSLTALLSMENTFTSDEKPKPGICTAKIPHCDISIRWKFLTVKIPYSEKSVRRKLRTTKFPYGEKTVRRKLSTTKKSYGENRTAKNLTAKIPSTNKSICLTQKNVCPLANNKKTNWFTVKLLQLLLLS